jgi:hypothetical protein
MIAAALTSSPPAALSQTSAGRLVTARLRVRRRRSWPRRYSGRAPPPGCLERGPGGRTAQRTDNQPLRSVTVDKTMLDLKHSSGHRERGSSPAARMARATSFWGSAWPFSPRSTRAGSTVNGCRSPGMALTWASRYAVPNPGAIGRGLESAGTAVVDAAAARGGSTSTSSGLAGDRGALRRSSLFIPAGQRIDRRWRVARRAPAGQEHDARRSAPPSTPVPLRVVRRPARLWPRSTSRDGHSRPGMPRAGASRLRRSRQRSPTG